MENNFPMGWTMKEKKTEKKARNADMELMRCEQQTSVLNGNDLAVVGK